MPFAYPRGGGAIAEHLAAKVPDAAATSYCPVKTDYGVAAYMPS
nr:MAG TPA: hypothetical protein [Caudoviricetes sp.]